MCLDLGLASQSRYGVDPQTATRASVACHWSLFSASAPLQREPFDTFFIYVYDYQCSSRLMCCINSSYGRESSRALKVFSVFTNIKPLLKKQEN